MASDLQSHIDRLGFEVWADNQFMDAIENFVIPSGKMGSGNVLVEHSQYTLGLEWDSGRIVCTMMCHTKDGWKNTEKEIKR